MEQNIAWFYEKRALAAVESLKKNRMNGVFLSDPVQAVSQALALIPAGASVAMGGSVTMFQLGLVDALRQADVKLIDRYEPGISPQEMGARFRAGLTADVFISGVNAITEQGELVFVDATCNRVAGVLFGPTKVIIVAGCNKIVPNLAYAQERIRHFVAPTNAKRLNRKTPCAATGQCEDCNSPERICNATVVVHKQANPDRLHVLLVNAELGY